jgi:hypothetical protein
MAIINATRGIAARLRNKPEKVTRLKKKTTTGKTPSCAVSESAKISLMRNGSRGSLVMILG